MSKLFLFSFGISFSLFTYPSVPTTPIFSRELTPQITSPVSRTNCCSRMGADFLSNDNLQKLECEAASKHKVYYSLPTPVSFGEFQTETPFESTPINSLQEWLDDGNKLENQLAALDDYRTWLKNTETTLFNDIKRQFQAEKLIILKNQRDKEFNVSNRKVIGGKTV